MITFTQVFFRSILIFLLLIVFTSLSFTQAPGLPPNAKAGECYAKCLIAPSYDSVITTIALYLGTDSMLAKQYTVDTILTLRPESVKWVKKSCDRKCLSDDPEDCLVWCLEPTKAQTLRIQRYLLDTTVTSDYISQKRYVYFTAKPGGYTEWQTIVCPHKVTPKLVQKVRTALGMKEDKSVSAMNSDTRAALTTFQRKHGLPIGQLTKETLKKLKVKFPR